MKKSLLSLGAFLFAMSGWAQAWQDVTDTYIKNADLTETETVNNKLQPKDWIFTNLNACDASVRVAEFYAGWGALNVTEAKASQTVNLPAGTYRLEGYSFFRQGQNWDTNKEKSLGYIYAGEDETLISTLGSVEVKDNKYANTVAEAGTAFYTNKLYPVSVEFTVDEAGDVEIGFKCTFDEAYSWMIFGEVDLYQYMNYADVFATKKANLEAVLEELNGTTVYTQKITDALIEGEQVMTGDDTEAQGTMLENLETLYVEVQVVLPKAKALNEALAACSSLMDNSSEKVEGAKDDLNEGLESIKQTLNIIETTEELDKTINQVESLRQEYVLRALPADGGTFDYTFLIEGVGNSIDGWSRSFSSQNFTYKSSSEKDTETLKKDGFLEVWNPEPFSGTLTYTQTGLPVGRYRIWAYAFTCVDGESSFIANEKSVVMDNTTALYTQPVIENLDIANGILTFGLNIGAAVNWTGITNIHLEYVGQLEDASAYYSVYQNAYYQLESYTYGMLNTALIAEVKEVLDAYKDVAQDDINALEAAYIILSEKIEEIQPLAELYNKAKSAYDVAMAEAENSTETVEGAKETLKSALEAQNALLDAATTTEALKAVAETIETARQAYVVNAKPNRACSLDYTFKIQNASFESGELTPWTATSASDTGVKKNADNYRIDNADGDYIFNTWGGSDEKDVQQTVTGLPAGVYSLTVLVATDANLKVAVTAGEVTDTMTVVNAKEYGEDFTVERVTVGEDGELLIKVSSKDWFKVDNFRLTRVSEEYDEVKLMSITPSPEDENLVEGISEFILTFNQDVTLNEDEDAPVVSLMRNILTPSIVDGTTNQIRLTPLVPITTAGRYMLMIPELLVLDADGNYNADTTLVYIIPEKVIDTENYEYVSVNPAEGNVESLKNIEITFAEGTYSCITDLWTMEETPYLLNTTTQEQIGVSLESVSLDFVTDLNKIRAVVAEEVTEEGKYTLVIPAKSIFESSDEWGSSILDYSPEIRLSYTIGEDGVGIDSILAEGDATVDVYAINGVLVKKDAGAADLKSLKKGIYIINGKKIVVK